MKRYIAAIFMLTAMALPAMTAVAHGANEIVPGGWGSGHMSGGWHYMFGPLMMLVFLALIVGLVVLMVRWLGAGSGARAGGGSSARAILDERYARGEIDRTEYLERKKDLS
ncbi:MAG: SHOCT domain-containing protein [Alphaproteobacteria bacterium]